MTTTVKGAGGTTYTPKYEPGSGEGAKYSTSGTGSGGGSTPGGSKPDDFGHGDYNHDGVISDAEARVYQADKRSEDMHYQTDSRERIAYFREEGKNYRAQLQAQTAAMQSGNDTKAHKWFGINTSGSSTVMMGPPPSKPE
jgi:hypothetical protein